MKKIITMLILTVCLTSLLFGCAVATEDNLVSRWKTYERYEYEVSKDNTTVGTLVLESTRIDGEDVTIGDETYTELIGTKINYELTIGEDIVIAEVFLTPKFMPLYSYKQIIDESGTTTLHASYAKKDYNYTIINDEGTTNNSISLKSTCYDNEMVYYIIRSIKMAEDNFSFTFNVPSPFENRLQNRTASLKEKTNLTIMDELVECYEVNMALNQTISGDAYQIYYGVNPIIVSDTNNSNDIEVSYPMVKFIEGEYEYILTSLSSYNIEPGEDA